MNVRSGQTGHEGTALSETTRERLLEIFNQLSVLERGPDRTTQITLCRRGLDLLQGEQQPLFAALLKTQLAKHLIGHELGDRADTLAQAIVAGQDGLRVLQQLGSEDAVLASVHEDLALAFGSRRQPGDHAEAARHYRAAIAARAGEPDRTRWALDHWQLANLGIQEGASGIEDAISHCQSALTVFTQADKLDTWARVTILLGVSYLRRTHGPRGESLQEAIRHFQAVIASDLEETTELRAIAHHNLASACEADERWTQQERIERIITHNEQALRSSAFQTQRRFAYPAHRSLAVAYGERTGGDPATNFSRAALHFEAAIGLFPSENDPAELTGLRLGAARLHLAHVPREAADAERALAYLTDALEAASRGDHRELAAAVHHQLGNAYLVRREGGSADNIERAIASFQQASALVDRQADAGDWAALQWRLCDTYSKRLEGDPIENCETAIKHGEDALSVFTMELADRAFAHLNLRLADLFSTRVIGSRDENLDRAIAHAQNALKVFRQSETPFEWARCHSVLGNAHLLRELGAPQSNEDSARQHFLQALEVVTPDSGPENWALLQNNVGLVWYRRSRRDRVGNIEAAIQYFRRALAVAERDGSMQLRAQVHANLGVALADRTDGQHRENEEAAIAHLEDALSLYAASNSRREWAKLQYNLGRLYVHRRSGDKADNIEKAIAALEQALEIRTPGTAAIEWAVTQDLLGNAYRARVRGSPRENLARALGYYSRALEVLTPANAPYQWALAASNLAILNSERPDGDAAENIEAAIRLNEAALTVLTPEVFPVEWARVCSNLGAAYGNRLRGEVAANLETAIDYCHKAIGVYDQSDYPAEWASAQNGLGGLYIKRIAGERADNIERAIHHLELALTVRNQRDYPQDWATTLTNLGGALLLRSRGDRSGDLERAIEYLTTASRVLGSDAPFHFRVGALFNLAMSFRAIGRRGDVVASRRRAVATLQGIETMAARDQFPELWARAQSALGLAHFELADGSRADNVQAAIACSRKALEIFSKQTYPREWADTLRNLGAFHIARNDAARADVEEGIAHLRSALTVFSRDTLPAEYRTTHSMLGRACFAQDNHADALASFEKAISAGALLLASAYTESGRRQEVGAESALFAASAFCLIRLGRPGEALTRLEQGKARLLNEALALDNLDLAGVPESERDGLQSLRRHVRDLEAEMRLPPGTPARRTDRELADELRSARAELMNVIGSIRSARPDFMPEGLELPELLKLVPVGGAMVAPLFTAKGSAAIVLPHSSTTVTPENVVALDEVTDVDLRNLLQGPDHADLGGWLGAYAKRRTDRSAWLATIEATGQLLWEKLLGQVHQRLQAFGLQKGAPILLLPQAGLGILPLHAAWRWVEGRKSYFLDDYTPCYVPSSFALHASYRHAEGSASAVSSLLAVIDPTDDLPYAPAEGEAVLQRFAPLARESLVGGRATAEAVIGHAPGQRYVHFACHGVYDWQQPMRSRLLLANGQPMTLADVIGRLDVSATRLVTLSACETGLTDIGASPDEYLGLPTAFLQRGAPGVLSTLWAVSDFSTMLLMDRFYRAHLEDGLPPASALRVAQCWLRDATNHEVAEQLRTYAETMPDRIRLSFDTVKRAFARDAAARANDRPFSHPYYWAAFTVSGA